MILDMVRNDLGRLALPGTGPHRGDLHPGKVPDGLADDIHGNSSQ